ncbi:unnamed protein product [Mytilus coruscus]|uniref:Mab-21-like nucleotidyltransferase domain-containing protein n=1 Tax=Mytilus coruscus TaxID=42192 RepID=A0A6J8E082_MYTCO|nr:unnamed protein product [Mytilus coruscus]
MADMSISLYHYLCKNIVGTENHVKTIRLMNTVCDHLSSEDNRVYITSGSFGEGLEMRGSDIDIMFVLKRIEVNENITSHFFNPKKTYFSLKTEDTKPGFAMLCLISSPSHQMLDSCETYRMDNYLSNALFRKRYLNEASPVEHGPCISDTDGLTDLAHCLHNISISLYQYLCKNIVGSENHVKTLKLMNTVSDNLSSDDIRVSITSGSFGEGLQMIGSDLDIMNYHHENDTPFHHVSLSLYNYMCKHIIGTDNHIKTIRLMNTVCDNLSHYDYTVTITSGSFGEGLQMLGSDLDIMYVSKPINIHDKITSTVLNPTKTHFSLITEGTKPGFAMLRLICSPHPNVQNLCEKFRQNNYLSNVLFKKTFLSDNTSVIHGPCITDIGGYIDGAYCLHELSVTQRFIVKWFLAQKQGVVRSLKFVLVDGVELEASAFVPAELLIEGTCWPVPSVIYAHFLSFLCHYHLNNVQEGQNSLQDLQLTMAEQSNEPSSYYCLGTALQLMGDNDSAKQAFIETVKLSYPYAYSIEGLKRLSMIASL